VIVGPAKWPAIVNEDTFRAVFSVLTDPSRRRQQGNEPRWLGSGIYTRGLCGGPLRAATFGGSPSRGGYRAYHYRCGTPHLTVAVAKTDEFVRGVVMDLVRDPPRRGSDAAP
jgi:site-specific DNA recombinase